MRNFKSLFYIAAATAFLSSCNNAVVEGKLDAVPSSDAIVVKTINGSQLESCDTLKLGSDCSFKLKVKQQKGQPEFYYFYYGKTRLCSVVLDAGYKLDVKCDTLGHWSVEGSQDNILLCANEMELAELLAKGSLNGREFIDYYRKQTKFVFENCKSMATVPVLFSKYGDTPVFFQNTDGMIFCSVADSLETVYPDSKYVKALRTEGEARCQRMELEAKIKNAAEASYIDLSFDSLEGKPVKFSEVAGNTALLVFWSAEDAGNKLYNKDILLPLYEKYAPKGLNIYAVSVGVDKSSWAIVAREQNLPWYNVCDKDARSVAAYGLTRLPELFLLHDGQMRRLQKNDAGSLDRELSSILK